VLRRLGRRRGDRNTPSLLSRASGLMIVRSVAQLRLLFERLGFEMENQWTSEDSTGRAFFVGDAAVSAGRGGAGGWRPGPRGERSRLPARHAAATPPVGRAAPL